MVCGLAVVPSAAAAAGVGRAGGTGGAVDLWVLLAAAAPLSAPPFASAALGSSSGDRQRELVLACYPLPALLLAEPTSRAGVAASGAQAPAAAATVVTTTAVEGVLQLRAAVRSLRASVAEQLDGMESRLEQLLQSLNLAQNV